MTTFKPGLVHAPVTPFKRDEQIDFSTYGKLIEFHLANGADALAVPYQQQLLQRHPCSPHKRLALLFLILTRSLAHQHHPRT